MPLPDGIAYLTEIEERLQSLEQFKENVENGAQYVAPDGGGEPLPEPLPVKEDEGWMASLPGAYIVCAKGDSLQACFQDAQSRGVGLRLEAGGEWDAEFGELYRSGTQIGVIGTGPRPILKIKSTGLHTKQGHKLDDVQIVGIHFKALDRKNAISWLAHGTNILVEDCKFEDCRFGVVFQPDPKNETEIIDGLTLNRNIFVNCHSDGTEDASGAYLKAIKNGRLLGNVFDKCGRRDAQHPERQHGVYISPNVDDKEDKRIHPWEIASNIFSRCAGHGGKFSTGGLVWDNLFYRCSIGFFVSRGTADIQDNAVLFSDDLGWGYQTFGADVVYSEDNIVANSAPTRPVGSDAFDIRLGGGLVQNADDRIYGPHRMGSTQPITSPYPLQVSAAWLKTIIEQETERSRLDWSGLNAIVLEVIRKIADDHVN